MDRTRDALRQHDRRVEDDPVEDAPGDEPESGDERDEEREEPPSGA